MEQEPGTKTFRDVIHYIDERRVSMRDKTPFFSTLKDQRLPKAQRLAFVPYMLFFSLGSPDVKTLMMRTEKPSDQLTDIEKKFDSFISEDNFHYNFYLRDLERLGCDLDDFGSVSAVIRHVFAEEGISTRRVVYGLASYIHDARDPVVAMAIPEIIEAGLFDLFTTVYVHVVKSPEFEGPLKGLEYFGDKHVKLEQNHTVTSWFAPGHPEDKSTSDYPVPDRTFRRICEMTDDLMGRFGEMYDGFERAVKEVRPIQPEKFRDIRDPAIDKVTHKDPVAA